MRARLIAVVGSWSVLVLGAIGLGAPPVAEAGGLTVVPSGHGRPPLRVKAWTDRGSEAIYHPGEPVEIRFTTNDHAYVVVYDIDTEGHVTQLFPAPGDPGYVHAREVITLPGHGAYFDYVVTGPPGIETIEVVASRAPLHPWESAIEGPWEEEQYDYDEHHEDDDDYDHHDDQYEDDGDYDHDGYEDWEDQELEGGGPWDEGSYRGHGFIGGQVSGDPFVAIGSLNRRLVPVECEARDYDTAYLTFYVEQHVSYPRYSCNDCHGTVHGYDPYVDHCSVFAVDINWGWVYPSHHVHVVHEHVLGPRYVYVRHENVPVRYKHLKRKWSGHDRKSIDRDLKPLLVASHKKKGHPGTGKVTAPPGKGWPEVKSSPSKSNPKLATRDGKGMPPTGGKVRPEYRAPKRSGGDAPQSKVRPEYRAPKRSGGDAPQSKARPEYRSSRRSGGDAPQSKARSEYQAPKRRGDPPQAKVEGDGRQQAAARWEGAPPQTKARGNEGAVKGRSPAGKDGGGQEKSAGKSKSSGNGGGGSGEKGKSAAKRR
jgi:Domain of unknown function (DUF4384)